MDEQMQDWFKADYSPGFVCQGSSVNKIMIACLLFNRQPLTKLCLENLFNYTLEPFDLFLWDNGSEKPTQDLLDKLEGMRFVNGSTITIIRNKTNIGISDSQAQLQKLRCAGQHFMKLDNDVIVPKDPIWLTVLREVLERNTDGFQVAGYSGLPSPNFYSNPALIRHVLTFKTPLSDGRLKCDAYRATLISGFFMMHSIYMDKFVFPSGVRKYGEGCDAAVSEFSCVNSIPMLIVRPPSSPDWMDNHDHLTSQCPEWVEYHAWKVSCLNKVDKGDFRPTVVGNDTSELRIRKELML